jgi:hypothetical protein
MSEPEDEPLMRDATPEEMKAALGVAGAEVIAKAAKTLSNAFGGAPVRTLLGEEPVPKLSRLTPIEEAAFRLVEAKLRALGIYGVKLLGGEMHDPGDTERAAKVRMPPGVHLLGTEAGLHMSTQHETMAEAYNAIVSSPWFRGVGP